MTPKEHLFVSEYLLSLNGADAYRKAGYSHKGANVEARKILTKPHIAAEIARQLEERCKRLEIDADALLRRAATILTADPRELSGLYIGACRFVTAGIMTFSGARSASGLQPATTRRRSRSRTQIAKAGSAITSRSDRIRNARSATVSGCRMPGLRTRVTYRLRLRSCSKA
jgi:hypothetical protein